MSGFSPRSTSLMALMITLASISSVALRVQRVEASGTIYIRANGLVEGTDKIVTMDNITYTFTDNINDSIVVERDNIIVDGAGCTLQGTGDGLGINLSERTNVTIRNTQIRVFDTGIYLSNSSNNDIIQDIIRENKIGIHCFISANHNSISNNNVTANWLRDISLYDSSDNVISGNNMADSQVGLWNQNSSDNIFKENTFGDNSGYGIYFQDTIGATIIRNNFINNTRQVYLTSNSPGLIWDEGYPSGGNYWSDYALRYPDAEELNGSGLWATPYVIYGSNPDNYPLMYLHGSKTCKLAISTTSGGTTDPSLGIHTFLNGTYATVTALPDMGYSFSHWQLEGEDKVDNPMVILLTANDTLEAFFVDDIAPSIGEPVQDPSEDVAPNQTVAVTVEVIDFGTGVYKVTLWYSIDNGTIWIPLNMTGIFETFQTTIPGYEYGAWVTYKIVAYDNAGNNSTKDNFGYYYKYPVIPEFPSTLILSIFMIATLLTVVIYKRKRKDQL